jgi:hypothetical protein
MGQILNKRFSKTYISLACHLKPDIPATQEAEIKRILVQGQSRQNILKTPSQLPVMWESTNIEGLQSRPYLKNNQSKMGW